MNANNDKVPVLFLIFNRKEVSVESMKSIQEYRPNKLYIAADGPRALKEKDKEKCEETRKAVLGMINWHCEINTFFRDDNLGCAKAVSGALDWFFANEEFGVVIEDDVIISQDFYYFAKAMDQKYRDDKRILCINAQYIGKKSVMKTSYDFSSYASPWGWASWRRAWEKMDMKMSLFPKVSVLHYLRVLGLVRGFLHYYYYWKPAYKIVNNGGDISSWATRWTFNVFANGGYVITPSHNLAVNIGCSGVEGAHYLPEDENLYAYLQLENMPKNLVHPSNVKYSNRLRNLEDIDFFRIRYIGLIKKIKKLISRHH